MVFSRNVFYICNVNINYKAMKYRSVQLGVIAISIVCISVLLLTMFFFYEVQQRENANINRITNGQRDMMVDNITELMLAQDQTPVFDNSAWDELLDAMEQKDMEWLDVNIGYMSIQYCGATVALFDTQNKLFYENVTDGYKDGGFDFYSGLRLPAMFRDRYKSIFYSIKNDKLFSYYVFKLVHADDILTRKEEAKGYLMLVKEYTDSVMTEYSRSLGSIKMHVAYNSDVLDQAALDNARNYFYYKPLNNQYGNPVAYLYFTAENELDGIFFKLHKLMLGVFGIVLVMLVILILYTQLKIVRPLHKVVDVFYNGDVSRISRLKRSRSEFGVLSGYIEKFFNQKEEADRLHKEVVEQNRQFTDQQDLVNSLQHTVEAQEDTIATLHQHIVDANRDKELKVAQLSINEQILDEQMQNIMKLGEQLNTMSETKKMYEKQFISTEKVISDNQNYAIRLRTVLQVALTPTKHILQDFFVLEMQKDNVGGDFYFAKSIENWVVTGVGDCNMQGVSGALQSSVDLYLIDAILQMNRTTELRPNMILNELNRKIQSSIFSDLDTDIERDGLHISVFMYDKDTNNAFFSASKRTMLLLRKGEVIEYFGDNFSVGRVHDDKSFNCINFSLEPEDIVYMFSDGCTEVVGGPFCRKFMTMNLKKEIAKRHLMTLTEQKTSFREFYEKWIGDLVQTDDITLFGFKV